MDDAQSVIASAMTERDLYERVREMALQLGWLVYHTYDSRRSYAGFPDVALAKPGRPLILAELKREGGRLSRAQEQWLAVLSQVPGIEVYVWRPRDWVSGEVEAVLRGQGVSP